MEEYLTIEELAARLKLSAKTVRNKMANGVFKKGQHFYSPSGLGPRFKWSAVLAWLERTEDPPKNHNDSIPMPRSCRLSEENTRKLGSIS